MSKKKIVLFAIDSSGAVPNDIVNQIKNDIVRKLGTYRYFNNDDVSAHIVSIDTDPHNLQFIDELGKVYDYRLHGCGGTDISGAIKKLTDNGFPEIDELFVYSDMYVHDGDLPDLESNNPNTNITLIDCDYHSGKTTKIPEGMKLETDVIKHIYIRGDEEKDSCSLMYIRSRLVGLAIKDVKQFDCGLCFEFTDGTIMETTYDTSEMGSIFFEVK